MQEKENNLLEYCEKKKGFVTVVNASPSVL